ncbi:MAG: helix-turn-helix transcriptional regulator [Oscillospiraceae bacterium]|nr:helix-turn-helix transcriptional regulator [Oscillospiraceae bacterium]
MDTVKTGTYLAMLRRARGATQQEIADRLGVSNKTVSKWESGGGLPDITVLPALAELYGVTADDILAGETLTDRRRSALESETAAQRKRLLARLRLRFDICLIISLVLVGLAFLGIVYVSPAALPLSVGILWIGYILVVYPIYYGGAEADGALWQNVYRKLLAASAAQWWMLLRMVHLGKLDVERTELLAQAGRMTLYYAYDEWKPLLFCMGLLVLYLLLRWGLKRSAGPEARLLPEKWRPWLVRLGPWIVWAVLFFLLWKLADERYELALAPWKARYGTDVMRDSRFEGWPKLKASRDAELMPYFRACQAVLAAGGASGLGLLGWTAWSALRRKKPPSPLADPQK